MAKTKQNKTTQFPTEEISYVFKGQPATVNINVRISYESYTGAVAGCVQAIMKDGYNAGKADYMYNAILLSLFTDLKNLEDPAYVLDVVYDSDLLTILGQKSMQACSFYQAVQSQLDYEKSKSALDNLLITLNDKLASLDTESLNKALQNVSLVDLSKLSGDGAMNAIVGLFKNQASSVPKRGRPSGKK